MKLEKQHKLFIQSLIINPNKLWTWQYQYNVDLQFWIVYTWYIYYLNAYIVLYSYVFCIYNICSKLLKAKIRETYAKATEGVAAKRGRWPPLFLEFYCCINVIQQYYIGDMCSLWDLSTTDQNEYNIPFSMEFLK